MVAALFDDGEVEVVETVAVVEVEANEAVLSVAALVLIMVDVLELAIDVAVLIMLADVVIDPTEDCTCGKVAFTGCGDCMAFFCTAVGAGDAIFCWTT